MNKLEALLPGKVTGQGYVTSDKCQVCHPQQYSSWYASYHRTMTQVAASGNVLAPFDDIRLQDRGRQYHLERREDEFWVHTVDPAWEIQQLMFPRQLDQEQHASSKPPRIKARVIMTTGSRHLQAYWIKRPDSNGIFFQFPWIYHIAEQRWIPSADSFLMPPPQGPVRIEVWNSICIDCHTVGGQPQLRRQEETMFSQATLSPLPIHPIGQTQRTVWSTSWSRAPKGTLWNSFGATS